MSIDLQHQLTKTQQELAALKAEYEEFVYIVSHDLQAPLRQIEGFSDIIWNKYADNFDEKSKRHFDLIIKGSTKIKELLDALITYSRINTHAQPFSTLNLNDIVADVLKQSSLLKKTDATISCDNLPTIVGDNAQITHVFYQLIHNALFYQTAENRPDIKINVIELAKYWQFCITDNGIGISENLTEKVFKIFRRAVSEKQYVGTGMGLPIAQKILLRHQGNIWLETEKNVGSAFYFTIAKGLSNE
jgi:light-regulated signal transduction histidine kinase (bacteriophytochrome)